MVLPCAHECCGGVQVILNMLAYGDNAGRAVVRARCHDQIRPDHLLVEDDYPACFVADLRWRGHYINTTRHIAVTQVVARVGTSTALHAFSDPRKGGIADGY